MKNQTTNDDRAARLRGADASDGEAVPCPSCGYDMRYATDNRCSECGLVIDRAALSVSGVPWAHRRQIGRVRAFVRTVWQITFDKQRLRQELVKPQQLRDARAFGFRNAAAVAAALIVISATLLFEDGIQHIAIQPGTVGTIFARGRAGAMPDYAQDLAVPWSAGATLLPVVPLYLIGLALYLAGAARPAMRHTPHGERAQAMAAYAAAPLAWLLPAGICFALTHFLLRSAPREMESELRIVGLIVGLLALALGVVAVVGFFLSVGRWYARAHHAGAARFMAGISLAACNSLLGIVLFLGLVPWCVGLLWIILDSLRCQVFIEPTFGR